MDPTLPQNSLWKSSWNYLMAHSPPPRAASREGCAGKGLCKISLTPEMLPQMNLNLISIQSESDRIVMQVEI